MQRFVEVSAIGLEPIDITRSDDEYTGGITRTGDEYVGQTPAYVPIAFHVVTPSVPITFHVMPPRQNAHRGKNPKAWRSFVPSQHHAER